MACAIRKFELKDFNKSVASKSLGFSGVSSKSARFSLTAKPARKFHTVKNFSGDKKETKTSLSSGQLTTSILSAQLHSSTFKSVPQIQQETKSKKDFVQRPVLLHEEVIPEQIRFGPPKKHGSVASQYIPVTYGPSERSLRIQTPAMRMPFGVKHWEGSRTVQLALSFDDMTRNKEIKAFHDMLKRIDDKVLQAAHKEAKSWFKKEVPQELLVHNYKASVRPVKPDQEHLPPILNLKIPLDKDLRPAIEVYTGYELAPVELLMQKGAKVLVIMEPRSIYFLGGSSFGISWIALQAKVLEAGSGPSKLVGYGFVEDPVQEISEEIPDREE